MALSRFNLFQKYTQRSKSTCIRLTFIRNYSIPQNILSNEKSSTKTLWTKEENITFLEYLKVHGLEGSSSELSAMLKKSEPAIDTKRYFMRQSIIAEQLYLSAEGKDASIQSAIESLIEKVKTEDVNPSEELIVDWKKIQPNYEKDPSYYDKLLESLYSTSSFECTRFDEKLELGMKLFGNDVDKIQKILLPQFEKKSLMKSMEERSQRKVSTRTRGKGLPKEKVEVIKAALLNVLQSNEKVRLADIARSVGCSYFSVHRHWTAIRKEKNLPLLKVRGSRGLDLVLGPDELEKFDKRIIEYATSTTKSLQFLANETGICKPTITSGWALLRKQHNLKGVHPQHSLQKMRPDELESFDKRIIEYATSTTKSLSFLANETAISIHIIRQRWALLRKKHDLTLVPQRRILQTMSPDELERFDKRIIEYATSSRKSMRLLAKETGIYEKTIRHRWSLLRKKGNLKSVIPRNSLQKMSPDDLERFDKRIMEYATSSTKSMRLLVTETGIKGISIYKRWAFLREKHNMEFLSVQKMSPNELEKFDRRIIKYATSSKKSIQLLAYTTGISIESINRRWEILRKKLDVKTIKDRPSLQKMNPYELEKFDKLIIEYATSTTKSMQLLAEETGIPAKNIHRRWKLLRKKHNLKSVNPRPSLQIMSPDEWEKFDKRIIEYATSTTKSLSLLASETAISTTTIVRRWALLRKKHDLKVVRPQPSLQKMSPDEREKFDKRIIEYATSATKTIPLLANETGIPASIIFNRWTLLRKKHSLKTGFTKKKSR